MDIFELKDKVIAGYDLTKEEAMSLYEADYEDLKKCANEIREHYCGTNFNFCTIINAKSGKCSEDCKFCAQSGHYGHNSDEYGLLKEDVVVADAQKQKDVGIERYSLVTSGKRLSDEEVDRVCETIKKVKSDVGVEVCASFGLLSKDNYQKLYDVGVRRVHNNLESSREFFATVCSTHSFDEKIDAIKAAQEVGLEVCSGGIIGLGETREDRINMAFDLKELKVDSVPVNILNPIKGTPMGDNERLTQEEINRTIAIYRFILKDVYIRLAGGRALLSDTGKESFMSGANASISGTLLTTQGMDPKTDIKMINELGYNVVV
ncbi:MAG: biotin synthase BioB [Peptoniphilus sp.]|uniref:biotin synthase BioB n=1 Tax=Peptoniphilus sp. TaxID=1971214 RepID=UPI002A7592E1|nr:biotin synthase BioB [Peptoniphilus sp.]MDY2986599.1 biotin synthase BioB [Peptoniphilus sp.]